jgi:hypothetical protein
MVGAIVELVTVPLHGRETGRQTKHGDNGVHPRSLA